MDRLVDGLVGLQNVAFRIVDIVRSVLRLWRVEDHPIREVVTRFRHNVRGSLIGPRW